jgi:hypothetical protein
MMIKSKLEFDKPENYRRRHLIGDSVNYLFIPRRNGEWRVTGKAFEDDGRLEKLYFIIVH